MHVVYLTLHVIVYATTEKIIPCYLERKTCIWIHFRQGKRRRQTVSLQELLLTKTKRNYYKCTH